MLIVLEGPDEVGKTTLCEALASRMTNRDVAVLSFPGREIGTPGHLVYVLHHEPHELGVEAPTATSMQLFHCAAHADVIEKRLAPALASGRTVVLDRSWWSLIVYARAGGVAAASVDALLATERALWSSLPEPHHFLIDAPAPHAPVPSLVQWSRIREGYLAHADAEKQVGNNVRVVANEGSVEEAVDDILRTLL